MSTASPVLSKNKKNINFFLKNFSIFTGENSQFIAWASFHNTRKSMKLRNMSKLFLNGQDSILMNQFVFKLYLSASIRSHLIRFIGR